MLTTIVAWSALVISLLALAIGSVAMMATEDRPRWEGGYNDIRKEALRKGDRNG
jgi:hypothetical protein